MISDFEEWKVSEETTTGAFYRKSHQYINKVKGFMTSLYLCHRDGKCRSFSTGQRSTKRQGSCKIDATCPSTIRFKMDTKTLKCTVDYIPTHVGHDADPQHTRLHKGQRQLIAEKIKEQIPAHQILEEVNNQIPEGKRALTFKDVHNIRSCFEKEECQLHSDDHVSVGLWAGRLKEQTLYYNPKGNSDPVHKVDDFVLVFQQSQCFFSEPQIIWVGTTRDLIYDYHLVSVVAVNKNGVIFPIAQMITSVMNEDTLTVLYSCIKTRHGIINCSYIMIRNASFSTPWEKVMENTDYKKILCSWNVSEYWKEHLNLNHEESRNLYKSLLHLLQTEKDAASFQTTKEKIIGQVNKMHSVKIKLQCRSLILKYFKNKHTWAKCFRLDIHENTDNNIVRFENRMTKICFSGKLTGRLDNTLFLLLQFLNETKKFDNSIDSMLRQIRKSHRESLMIPDDYVEPIDDYWMVKCPRSVYKIQRGADDMCACEVRCSECDICEHTLDCSCGAGTAICKHIHAVARIFVINIDEPLEEMEVLPEASKDESNEAEQQTEIFTWTPINEVEIQEIEVQMDFSLLSPESVDEVESLLLQIENNEVVENQNISSNGILEKDDLIQQIQQRISSISKLCVEKLPQACDESVEKIANDLQNLETFLFSMDTLKSDLEKKSEKTSHRKTKHQVRKEASDESESFIDLP
ncbi:hypothetical protein B566_EDAN001898 [Ephemera danica]|nr:hypothetical protein B566_EDAN001898 [Ephemera danica]